VFPDQTRQKRVNLSLNLTMPKVVIGHPYFAFGGSESVVMWLVEALKRHYEITVLTTGGWDLPALNAYYGTQIQASEVQVRIAPVPWPFRNYSAAALRGACYQRFARQVAQEYDLRISAYNLTDWGLPAIHFIADFNWNPALREQYDPHSPGFIYQESPLRWTYLKLAAAYNKPTGRDFIRKDQIVANSHWSADLLKKQFGARCTAVIYPPVWTEFPEVPWEQKEEAFVMIGRIAPEKRIERAIAILDEVRQRGHRLRLHLCGLIEHGHYGRQIAQLTRERADWIHLAGRVTANRKAHILANCRFGIHTRAAEPFGISVAEMVKAGAIVFAPDKGGQAEILAHKDLLFSDESGAVDRICAVLTNSTKQFALRSHLKTQLVKFNSKLFVANSMAAMARFRMSN
jgi:glycosyltransferase involved in cell wall biosynthesis